MNIGVIPARLNSTRFPGKIMAALAGKPMVLHAYEQARKSTRLDKVIIAVDNLEVKTVLEQFGAEVVMTAENHQSGTDRVAEAVTAIDADIVVNIQGDEPLIEPALINSLISLFDDRSVMMASAASRNLPVPDLLNPNVVKVFLNHAFEASEFRRVIPDNIMGGCYRHIGIYAFRREVLLRFTKLPPSVNEKKHHLEQLRALDNGIPIRMLLTDYVSLGVDTPEDLELIAEIIGL